MTQAEDLQEADSSLIVNSVFNALLSYTAIMLNIIIIHALRKTSSLPKPLKTLLLSLAVSDLGVGLSVQPLGVANLVMRLKENTENSLTVKNTFSVFFCHVQFVLLCFIPWCNSSNSRQILGNLSSSQIPRTCDTQAR